MIRRAEPKDLPMVNLLLSQVLELHAQGRPDIFISGTKKYTDGELLALFADDSRPIFVHTDENDTVNGYAFCVFEETKGVNNMHDARTLYIDDLCVEEHARRQGIAKALFLYVRSFAKEQGCAGVTLNVWELNRSAKAFYEAMGMKPLKTIMEARF